MAESRKSVLIGIPVHKAESSVGTMVSALMAGSQKYVVRHQITGISLLANNFNRLFCSSWAAGVDFFVLMHSDVGVSVRDGFGGSWLELLIDRLQEHKLAALSAVVPIKSMDGLTSTALQLRKDSPHVLRRLSMAEMHSLPNNLITRADVCRVFGVPEDEAGALFINTAVLAIDLRSFDWAGVRWPGFQISDQIAWNTANVPMAFVDPEDWAMSRWLHGQGWPYAATKELIVDHHGGMAFSSQGNWGRAMDDLPRMPSIEEYERS